LSLRLASAFLTALFEKRRNERQRRLRETKRKPSHERTDSRNADPWRSASIRGWFLD